MAKVQAKFADVRFVFLPITLFILLNATGCIYSNTEINLGIARASTTERNGGLAQLKATQMRSSRPKMVEVYAPVDFYHSLNKPIIEADEIRVYEPANTDTGAFISKDVLKRDYRSGEPGFKAIKSAFLDKRGAEGRDIINSAAETKIVFLKKNKWLCQTFYNPPDGRIEVRDGSGKPCVMCFLPKDVKKFLQ